MAQFSITVEILASPERVWAVMRDVVRWHEWTQSVKSIKRIGKGEFEVGSRLLIRQPKFPPAVWKLTEIVDGKTFVWVSGSPGIRVTARHTVEANKLGTTVTLSLYYAGLLGPLFSRLTKTITERYLAFEANGLKQRSESAIVHE